MKSKEIRQRFFDYFTKHGHQKVASSSLIPAQDPTLLFTNAGMNQFKDVFLGNEKRSYTRAVTIQKCVRAGGKHNDLDNVGFTKRHLTFFEMMGNFSFADYFKKEAIAFAWEFLTKELQIPTEHLHVTVFETDDEAYNIWLKDMGIPQNRLHRCGAAENFWQMGDFGPCGPCTEIHLDRGPEFGCPDSNNQCGPACDCDRFLEIWNLVFMQYDRQVDGTLKPLAQTGVDTGMGLERLSAVMQNKDSVFNTDLFTPIIAKIEQLSGHVYAQQNDLMKAAFHVLADHIRSSTMLITDGCVPSNEGRGYVLRKIIRRAALFAQKLTDKNIFPELSKVVVQELGDIYPELNDTGVLVFDILTSEINKFSANLVRGRVVLEQYVHESNMSQQISGEQAFKLYDTYGFPVELVIAAAREQGYSVDTIGFEKLMEKQQLQSGKKTADVLTYLDLGTDIHSEFTGYHELETDSEVIALIENDTVVTQVPAGHTCYVITRRSPFFIVGGGQVPDQGWLIFNGIKAPLTHVRYVNNVTAAQIIAPKEIKIGDAVTCVVDKTWRTNAMKNHTATHLLQSALISLFGKHIKQSGSLVHPDYLRFDFSYHGNLDADDIKKVEDLVNEKIRENIPVNIVYTTLKDAIDHGALAFFGEKYKPEDVRMVKVDDFSVELCGGTHVPATGAIGTFKITEVSALAAGYRRIVAVTGPRAIELFQNTFSITKTLCQDFKVKREELIDTVLEQKEQCKQLQTQIKHLKSQLWHTQLPTWEKEITSINSVPFLFLEMADASAEELRDIAQALNKKQPGFYFLISATGTTSTFFATVDDRHTSKINLQQLSTWLKDTYHLRGGVKNTILQGGGGIVDKGLQDALKKWLSK
jgi:alanyl-tRNA synthetase